MLNRRTLFNIAAAGAGVLAVDRTLMRARAQGNRVRHPANTEAGRSHLRVLEQAVTIMQGRDLAHPVSRQIRALGASSERHPLSWQRQRVIHAGHWQQHLTWRFFPWHRAQLMYFEDIVRFLTGNDAFAMPYWDPREQRFLPPMFFNPESALYVVRRAGLAQFDFNAALAADAAEGEVIAASIAEPDFLAFGGDRLEGPGRVDAGTHGYVHVKIGGLMSDPATATLDPLFWLHHCNIDRIWASWQEAHGASEATKYPAGFSAEDLSGPFVAPPDRRPRVSAGDVINWKSLGFDFYALYSLPAFAPPALDQRWKLASLDTQTFSAQAPVATTTNGEFAVLPITRAAEVGNPTTSQQSLNRIDKATLRLKVGRQGLDQLALRVFVAGASSSALTPDNREAFCDLLTAYGAQHMSHIGDDGMTPDLTFNIDATVALRAALTASPQGPVNVVVQPVPRQGGEPIPAVVAIKAVRLQVTTARLVSQNG